MAHSNPVDLNSPPDDSAGSKLESQWRLALVARVELGPVGLQGTAVVHGDSVALDGLAVALDWRGDFDAEFGGGGEGAEGGHEDRGEMHGSMKRDVRMYLGNGEVDR